MSICHEDTVFEEDREEDRDEGKRGNPRRVSNWRENDENGVRRSRKVSSSVVGGGVGRLRMTMPPH